MIGMIIAGIIVMISSFYIFTEKSWSMLFKYIYTFLMIPMFVIFSCLFLYNEGKKDAPNLLTEEQIKNHKLSYLTQIKSGTDLLKMQEIVLSNQKSIYRIKTPKGWLVVYNDSMTFMPDTTHQWLKEFSYEDWHPFHIVERLQEIMKPRSKQE